MTQHTPTPWRVVERPSIGTNIEWGDGPECKPICIMRWTDGLRPYAEKMVKADAEFIVLACNSHDALVEACKALVAIERRKSTNECLMCGDPWNAHHESCQVLAAQKALALATKGEGA